ncbi:transposase, partial [Escherichia coli]|uniref:transposase n=1 Tax=Escherichia coli TaxID=562 RepID=UPI00111F8BEA
MKKRNFSAEFKRESAQLVVDQNYTVADAAKAMDIGLSTMNRPDFPGECFICELRLP